MLECLWDIMAYLCYKVFQARCVFLFMDSFKNNVVYQVFFFNDVFFNYNFGQFEMFVCFDINDEEVLLCDFLCYDFI